MSINKAGYTATEVACGWAWAVMKKAYPNIWAGAVMRKPPVNAENAKRYHPTDRPTDRAVHEVACTRLKIYQS